VAVRWPGWFGDCGKFSGKWRFSGSGEKARAGYGAAVRLMWETSHPLSFAVAGYALAASIMPNLVLIAPTPA
jgi:hypothetical protein